MDNAQKPASNWACVLNTSQACQDRGKKCDENEYRFVLFALCERRGGNLPLPCLVRSCSMQTRRPIFYNLALFLKKVHNWTPGKLKCRNGPRGSAPCIMAPRFHVSAPWITAPRSWTAFSRGSDVAGSSAPQITAPSFLLQTSRRTSLPVDTVHIFISPLGSFSPKTEHEFGFNIWTIKSLICSIDLEEPGILFHILVFDSLI